MIRRGQHTDLIAQFADAKSDFRAGKKSRYSSNAPGVSSLGSGADYHYRSEVQFLHMMETARHFERNDMVVGQAIRRLTANVIQEGFTPDPNTGSVDLDARLKDLWAEWTDEPDYCHSEGELNFQQIERLSFHSIIRDGDILHLPLKTGQLQPVEAHRLRTPRNTTLNVVHGVRLDAKANRTEYWITKQDLDPNRRLQKVSDIKSYAARDQDGNRQVLHLYFPTRFSQRRGITALAPISETVGMHDDVQFTTMVKQQMSALIALFRKRAVNGPIMPGAGLDGALLNDAGSIRQLDGVVAGLDITGAPGEELQGFAPNIPGPSFFDHTHLLLQFIAINLDMPVHMLLLDPSKTNFSGWRGAIDQARFRFREMQGDMVKQFHRPVWRWKVRQWIQVDEFARRFASQSGISPFTHKWKVPGFPYIDPEKDAKADDHLNRNYLNSLRRIHAARGRDWDEIVTEIVEDRAQLLAACIQKADELNRQFPGADVDWRSDLLAIGSPAAVSAESQEDMAEVAAKQKPAGTADDE